MEFGIEQNAAAIYALEQQQAIISHNLACSCVRGYQAQVVGVEGKNNGVCNFDEMKSMARTKPIVKSAINRQSGTFECTHVPTDVAIRGGGFFKVQNGDGTFSFTRDGSFHFDANGLLSDAMGRTVVGEGGRIQSENAGDPIFINSNGHVFEGDQQIGTLVAFKLSDQVQRAPHANYNAYEAQNILPDESVRFESGFLERSNVSPLREMVSMIQVSNAHEANCSLIRQLDNTLGEVVQTLGNNNG